MDMFEAVTFLRHRISSDGKLQVVHGAHLWTASFKWFPSATPEALSKVQQQLGRPLPMDYCEFLVQISNGGILFYDHDYGQWGFKLYSVEELVEKQQVWQKSIPLKWSGNFFAFAKLYGEANAMIFDLNRLSKDLRSCVVLEANAYDPVEEWPVASRSFHEWLDHLITAQGDKYWLWR